MAQRFVNPYTPYSPIGQGIANSTMALFGNQRTPAEQELLDEKAAGLQASTQLHLAQTAKAEQEAQGAAYALRQQQQAPQQLFQADTGLTQDRAGMLSHFLDKGQWAPGLELQPDWATPDVIDRGQRSRRSSAVVGMADKSNADQIAQAMSHLRLTDLAEQSLAGRQDPTKVASAFFPITGKAPYTGQATGATNVVTGDQTTNPIGTSLIAANVGRADAGQATADLARERTGVVRPLAQSLIDKRKQGGGGFSISFDENGNPIVQMGGTPLTKSNTDKVQMGQIEASGTKQMIGEARIVAQNPANFGLTGILRSTVQDAMQQGDALANQLGGQANTIQQEILSMGSDVNVREFDTTIPQLDMLVNILAFRMAKMNDPGGRVTDQDFKIAKGQIGGTGILANQKEFLSRLDLFEKLIDQQMARGNTLLNPGQAAPPGIAAPRPAAAPPGIAAPPAAAPVVKPAPQAPMDPASFIPTPTRAPINYPYRRDSEAMDAYQRGELGEQELEDILTDMYMKQMGVTE